jgi:SAM-dependent methyltransferase
MAEWNRERLRLTFEEVPELYDRVRPTYPAEVFDDLVSLAEIPPGGRLLEIGCGTGQATRPLAERGFAITCVELGEQLAAFAQRKLAVFPAVEVVNGSFETWEPPVGVRFDAIVAFTAFHWLDPAERFAKSARLLRDGGALAVVETRHVLPESGDPFWAEMQEDYDAVVPSPDNRAAPHPDEVDDLAAEIDASGLFGPVSARRYLWDVSYDADEWIDVLETYSGHRSIPAEQRSALYERLRRRIRQRPGGRVRRTYLAMLNVASRL